MLVAVAVMAAVLVCLLCSAVRYVRAPRPLTDLPPIQAAAGPIPPHYLFSFPASEPNGIAVTPGGNRVYVVETKAGQSQEVKVFDRAGKYLFSINPPPELVDPFVNPIYVALDKQGRVYVVDRVVHEIFIYTADGQFVSIFPKPELGDRLPPLGEALRAGPTFVDGNAASGYRHFDRAARVIDLSTLSGEPVERFPAFDDRLWIQQGIAFDQQGNLYITEVTSGRHGVYVFDAQGILKRRFGQQGQGPGQFEYPNDVAVDSRGRLYVTDTNNGRVQIFSRSGRLINLIGRSSNLSLPQGIGIDRDWLYVVDAVAGSVHVFDLHIDPPAFLFDIGAFGLDEGQFNYPADIAFDATGRIYITDRVNDRVQVWSY